jgi:uncharacterized Zn ribbon protein
VLIKDLKVTGSSTTLEMGAKVKSIKLVIGNRAMLEMSASLRLL